MSKKTVAFLSAEFGLDNDLPTYSGGLGILAGDIVNAAADLDYPFFGIGILYKGKGFMQHITGGGKEEKRDSEFDHDTSFLRPVLKNGRPLTINLPAITGKVRAKAYQIRLSDNCIAFFLSTDVDGNPPEWIADMDTLYGGSPESQVRQQILLGIGGVKLLDELGIKPDIFHINEGRPCFLIWEVTSNIMRSGNLSFDKAWSAAKEKVVYTNHTLLAAGNLTYPSDLVSKWAQVFAKEMNLDPLLLIKEGLSDENTFSITKFAINISKKHSAVSKVHASYAKKDWPEIDFIPITNGVHLGRWQDSDFRDKSAADDAIWELHMLKKRELQNSVVKRTGVGYDPERLVVTWARRLAEYKQPKIIFEDIKRLKQILTNREKPAQLLFAGNTHGDDPNAKSIIEEIIGLFATELFGHAIFIPNYNISLANHLTSGSDIWLNTPKGNLEACGTSGMKALANGVLNMTVLDGWTYEVDWKDIGWVLDPQNVAQSIYKTLEEEVLPLYYARENGLPTTWIAKMRASISLAEDFSAERAFKEYIEKLYESS